ncbi:anti-sigma factor domain-containing protein [Aliihoeflea sp. 40Bstr573]|uniref:anti-sigma factor n=1 Tax=Aliihoeflea sp. 40Bstr573 TaxID=2696467 RepID=UPI002095C9DF|nr:anti-sigma factor [Aliihoeflea sp. 40Bstr573]MCO6387541.1 anti-sigma factor [Aliihoeflea sp. 40Bstr573]
MTPSDHHEPELGGDEALAAEYVLGVLPASERLDVARRIDADIEFARLVEEWEARLSPLGEFYVPVEAPSAVKQALDRRLFAAAVPAASRDRASWWNSLGLWRGLAVASVVALALVVGWNLQPPVEETPSPRFVASLENPETDVRYLALYDEAARTISLSRLDGAAAAGQDFELWVIEGDEPPASLGVLGDADHLEVTPSEDLQGKFAAGAVLAVSLEPEGGSPTGQPTGPVVALGNLRSI